MAQTAHYVSIDLGAGEGAKIGLFSLETQLIAQTLLPLAEYGNTGPSLADNLTRKIEEFLDMNKLSLKSTLAVGVASPGLFRSDDTYLLAANLPFLNGQNLRKLLEDRTNRPVAIDNDANAGGLAEWKILQVELLYWVFGGGWGGAWISHDGNVQFSSLDWDGNDTHLHYSNEPGYSIPLEKAMLKNHCNQHGISYDRLMQILTEELAPIDGVLCGPDGSPDHIRAEALLSGPGRCRLFRAVVSDDDFYERFLDIHETRQMSDPSVAGKYISKLSSMRVEAAVETDRLFGVILARATRTLMRQARQDGIPEGVPICLGGKPSYALPYFGPSAQRAMGATGIISYLRPSIIDERGSNANLVGAAVLAEKAAGKAKFLVSLAGITPKKGSAKKNLAENRLR